MDDTRISALAILKETVTLMVREWKLFFILTASLSGLTVVIFWPVLDLYAEFLAPEASAGVIDEETSGLILDRITYLAFLIWPYLFLTYGALVIWSRAAIGGSIIAFDGGLQALLLRTARAFWRLFCGLGWVLLIGLDEKETAAKLLAHAYSVFQAQLGPEHPYTRQLAPLFEGEDSVGT